MCTLSTHFIFNKCPIYTHDGESAKFGTNSHDTDYSVCSLVLLSVSQQKVLYAIQTLILGQEKLGKVYENLEPWANPNFTPA